MNKAKAGALGASKKQITFMQCKKKALKHKFRIDFLKKDQKYYYAAYRNGWLKEITTHMPRRDHKPKPIFCIQTNQVFVSFNEASKKLNISQGNIGMFFKGIRKHVNGYTFKYM